MEETNIDGLILELKERLSYINKELPKRFNYIIKELNKSKKRDV